MFLFGVCFFYIYIKIRSNALIRNVLSLKSKSYLNIKQNKSNVTISFVLVYKVGQVFLLGTLSFHICIQSGSNVLVRNIFHNDI